MTAANPWADPLVYANGKLLPLSRATVPLADAGVYAGLGFMETFRTMGGRPHLWPQHQARLIQACRMARLTLPSDGIALNESRLRSVVSDLLERNGVTEATFRNTAAVGPTEQVIRETLVPRALREAAPRDGVVLRVLSLRRDNGEWLPRPKSLNGWNAWLGRNELARRAADPNDEGLFLSREGEHVVESPYQNIVWVQRGALHYPEPSLGGVAGTALAWLLGLGFPASPRRALLAELLRADAVFVLNSVRGVTPVRQIRGERDEILLESIASATHPLVTALRQQWAAALAATAAS